MKNEMLITFRSITFAQRGERILKKAGIDCTMQRTPRALAERGCGYCLALRPGEALAAVELFRNQELHFGKIYAKIGETVEERTL